MFTPHITTVQYRKIMGTEPSKSPKLFILGSKWSMNWNYYCTLCIVWYCIVEFKFAVPGDVNPHSFSPAQWFIILWRGGILQLRNIITTVILSSICLKDYQVNIRISLLILQEHAPAQTWLAKVFAAKWCPIASQQKFSQVGLFCRSDCFCLFLERSPLEVFLRPLCVSMALQLHHLHPLCKFCRQHDRDSSSYGLFGCRWSTVLSRVFCLVSLVATFPDPSYSLGEFSVTTTNGNENQKGTQTFAKSNYIQLH